MSGFTRETLRTALVQVQKMWLDCLQDKRSANRRLADLTGGPYKDLRIVRRAFL